MTFTAIETEEFKMTEIRLLPSKWEVARLGNVIDVIRNGTTKKQNRSGRGYPISRIETISTSIINPAKTGFVEGLSAGDTEIYRLKQGDILLSHINSEPYLGNSALYRGNPPILIHGMNLLLIRTDPAVLNSEFLNFLFNFYRSKGIFIGIASRAVNQSSINQGKIKTILVPLPPLPEQEKIAYVLSTVQAAIEKTDAVIKATRELKKSLMKHLFTYGPVSIDQAENVPLKETGIGFVPEEWEVINLGEYCNLATGKLNANQAVPGGLFPFFTCSQETYRIDRYSFDCEAVLLAGNNARGIYSVKYYSGKFDAYQRTYVITISDNSKLDYLYLKNALETKLEELRVGSIGTSTKFLTLKMLLNLRIPLPPLPLQIQMANLFSSVEHKAEAEENKKKALEALFRTLLSKLMTGKTRVNDLEVSV